MTTSSIERTGIVPTLLISAFFLVSVTGCGSSSDTERASSPSPSDPTARDDADGAIAPDSGKAPSSSLASVAPLTDRQYEQLGNRNDLDLTWLPSGGFFALVLHPSEIAAAPLGEKWEEIFHRMSHRMLPFAPSSLRRMVVATRMVPLLEQPGAGAASAYPGISIVMHFAQPIAPAAGLEALLPEGTQGRDFPPRQYGEGVLYDLSGISPQPEVRFFLWFPDDRTAVMIKGDQALVDDVLDGQPAEGPLAKRLARLDLADREAAAVVTLENKSAESAEPIVSLLQQIPESVLQGLLQNTRAAHFTLDFDSPEGSRFLEGRIEAKGEKESIALNEYLNGLVASGQFGLASFESQMEGAPPEALRGIQLAKTLLNQVKLAPVASGVRLSLVKPPGFHSRFVAFLHDRTKAAEQTARIALQHAHLKQLVLAMYVYSENHGALPPWAIASEQGRPLLSWRVALLPYLRQQDLYDRFHLDEPWDSPHNRQLIDRMPAVFESYAPNGSSGTTRYRLFVSEQTPFGRGESLKVTDIVDAAQTVMIAAVSPRHATVWTRPDPLPFRPGESLGYFDEQMALAMFDGQIFSQMSATTPFSQEQLDTMITGNVVSHGEAVAPRNPFPTQPPAGSTLPSDAPSIGTPSQSSQATSSEREGSLRRAAPPSPTAGNPFRNRATSRPQ